MLQQQRKSIIIAGAGIAGLACGQHLLKMGYDIQLLEASDRHGGRIKKLENFLPCCLEAGAQEIHYKQTKYYEMALKSGAKLSSDNDLEDYIWDEYQNKYILVENMEKKYPHVPHLFHKMEKQQDMTVMERLLEENYDPKFLHYYQTIMGGEYGATIEQISANDIGKTERKWLSDENFCLNNKCHIDILDDHYKEVYERIQYNSPVLAVKILEDQVEIIYQSEGKLIQIQANYFVSAVPITQVKKIHWTPNFSEERVKQLDLVQMGKGGKLFIQIDNPIPLKCCGNLMVKSKPNIIIWNNSLDGFYLLVGIITKDGADEIQTVGIEIYVNDIIQELNSQLQLELKVLKIHYMDWGNQKYIEGLYSFPSPGIKDNYRKIIGEPIKNKIFFCGEAYHEIFRATINGAMETGIQTAQRISQLASKKQQ